MSYVAVSYEIEACPVHDELRIKISCEKHPEREHLSPGKISLDRPHLYEPKLVGHDGKRYNISEKQPN